MCAAVCGDVSALESGCRGEQLDCLYTWLQSGRHFKFKLFWLRPENGHQMVLKWVSGDGFG